MRLGLALDHQFSENVALLVSADVEKTREMDTHLHAGAELVLMDLLALRLGHNADMLTAGAGVNYGNLAVQYAFEDNVIETVHRFGVGFSFGPSAEESRRAALAAEEQVLQERVMQSFRQRELERVEQLLAQADQALEKDDPYGALDHLTTCRILSPDHIGLDSLSARSYLLMGRHLKSRAT